MRKLSLLIIKSFLGPFILTFILILFILLMQFVWKYLDDLMGKGLELNIILELLLFQSTNLVQLALPLAILLSSIMTFGNLAETMNWWP
jgi:lipopolysaccharide export system permease protein